MDDQEEQGVRAVRPDARVGDQPERVAAGAGGGGGREHRPQRAHGHTRRPAARDGRHIT